jgi:hypothetical protein
LWSFIVLLRSRGLLWRWRCRRGIGIRAWTQHKAIGKTQVDGGKRAVKQIVLLLKLHEPIERRDLVPFGQHYNGAVVEVQVPPPLADAHCGDYVFLQFRPVGQRVDQGGCVGGRTRPDDKRKLTEFSNVLIGDELTSAVDQHELALIMPDSERSALL